VESNTPERNNRSDPGLVRALALTVKVLLLPSLRRTILGHWLSISCHRGALRVIALRRRRRCRLSHRLSRILCKG
jgi:hypothetical protein